LCFKKYSNITHFYHKEKYIALLFFVLPFIFISTILKIRSLYIFTIHGLFLCLGVFITSIIYFIVKIISKYQQKSLDEESMSLMKNYLEMDIKMDVSYTEEDETFIVKLLNSLQENIWYFMPIYGMIPCI